jgi:hypothetical protein
VLPPPETSPGFLYHPSYFPSQKTTACAGGSLCISGEWLMKRKFSFFGLIGLGLIRTRVQYPRTRCAGEPWGGFGSNLRYWIRGIGPRIKSIPIRTNIPLFAVGLLIVFLSGCPGGPGDPPPVTPPDTAALNALIAQAETEKTQVMVKDDPAEIGPGVAWVTSTVMNTLNQAIETAKKVSGDGVADQTGVDNEVSALSGALETFRSAIRTDGTKQSGFDAAELTALIAAAKKEKASAVISADGTDISASITWVTQAQVDALTGAITAAENAAASADDTTRDAIYQALEAAISAFKAAQAPGRSATIITITGFSAEHGTSLQLGLFENPSLSGSPSIYGYGSIQDGKAEVSLLNQDEPWAGSGSWYVGLMVNDAYYITTEKKSFSTGTNVSITFAEFQQTEINNSGNRGDPIGKISGSVTLTDVPSSITGLRIRARDSNYNWYSYDSNISLPENSDNTTNSVSWAIPLYRNDSNGTLQGQGGVKTLYFELQVVIDRNESFPLSLGTKDVNLDQGLSDVQAGGFGPVSLDFTQLSGTITVSNGGQPVPGVSIQARADDRSIGNDWLESPPAGASWSMLVPVQQGQRVSFSVYGYDSPNGGTSVFSKTLSPDATASVSNQPIGGINLTLGDISVGRLSGTVSFTNMPSPPPYRISVSASYGENQNQKWINNGSSASVTLDGNNGTWSLPRDDEFLAALEEGSQAVRFYVNITFNQGENSVGLLPPIEKTLDKDEIGAVDLGTVNIPTYIKLSGTFTGTYNGGTPPTINIYPRTQEGQSLGNGAYLNAPAPGAAWSLYVPVFASPDRVVFNVSAYPSGGGTSIFSNIPAAPSQTQEVYNQPISGIVIDIGDVRPDTLRVENGPPGDYTAYVTDTYIDNSNYSGVSGNKATGTGSGASLPLTWSSNKSQSYHVLISAGSVTKYKNYVSFYNGIGTVDWNDMTPVSGSGNN